MKIYGLSLIFIMLAVLSSCDHSAINSVPFRDLSEDQPTLIPFFAWKNSEPEKGNKFHAILIGEKGEVEKLSNFNEKPLRPFNQVGSRLFYPQKTLTGNDLKESPELISPNGKLAVKTSSVKTFADDLDNEQLLIRDTARGYVKKVTVPALSNGEMWPLFWHTREEKIYFMVSVGDDKGRSLQLWEYDLTNGFFQNIGDTNGDAFMSPDGGWIIWETGPTSDRCHLLIPN
jgi:hypothetical protein